MAFGNSSEPEDSRPFWVPPTLRFETLSPGLRTAIRDILNPAYKELVLDASTALEKMTGLSLVHLLWIEVVEQTDLGSGMSGRVPPAAEREGYSKYLDRHLKLLTVKERVSKFYIRLKEFKRKGGDL